MEEVRDDVMSVQSCDSRGNGEGDKELQSSIRIDSDEVK